MERTVTENIGLFKLTTGEEIISEFEDSENEFTMTAPRSVVPRQGPNNTVVTNIGPWFFSAPDDSYIIDKIHVIAYSGDVEKGLRDAYLTNTSGLQIANNLAGLKI